MQTQFSLKTQKKKKQVTLDRTTYCKMEFGEKYNEINSSGSGSVLIRGDVMTHRDFP